MDIAIVTGAETPLGLRLIESLTQQGCRVHGIGNNFSKVTFGADHFKAHAVDLSDMGAVSRTVSEIVELENRLDLLIHALDVTPGAPFEKLAVGNLEAVLKVGLLGPVLITRLALPNLLRFRGQLINIIPANKSGHPASAVNALIEGGLREMNVSLFDSARDAGLRVTNLILRQNSAEGSGLPQMRIDVDHVARVVERLIDCSETNIPNEITLYPRLSHEAEKALPEAAIPVDPYASVVLPPKEYFPPRQAKIPTPPKERVERTIPYSDEEMEERIATAIEDYEAHPERYETPDPKRSKRERGREHSSERPDSRQERPPAPAGNEGARDAQSDSVPAQNSREAGGQSNDSNPGGKRRSRRRGGRNRNRNRDRPADSSSGSTGGSPSVGSVPADSGQSSSRGGEAFGREEKVGKSERSERAREKPAPSQSDSKGSREGSLGSATAPAEQSPGASGEQSKKRSSGKKVAAKRKPAKKAAKKAIKKTEGELDKKAEAKPAKKSAKKKSAKKLGRKIAAKKAAPAAEPS